MNRVRSILSRGWLAAVLILLGCAQFFDKGEETKDEEAAAPKEVAGYIYARRTLLETVAGQQVFSDYSIHIQWKSVDKAAAYQLAYLRWDDLRNEWGTTYVNTGVQNSSGDYGGYVVNNFYDNIYPTGLYVDGRPLPSKFVVRACFPLSVSKWSDPVTLHLRDDETQLPGQDADNKSFANTSWSDETALPNTILFGENTASLHGSYWGELDGLALPSKASGNEKVTVWTDAENDLGFELVVFYDAAQRYPLVVQHSSPPRFFYKQSGSSSGTEPGAPNNVLQRVIDADGNLYVADTGNHRIRKISPGGMVTYFAGTGAPGSANGTGPAASFNSPGF